MNAAITLIVWFALLWHVAGSEFLSVRYVHNVLISLDFLVNALCNGAPGETVSAHAYRAKWSLRMLAINWLFRNENHCQEAYGAVMARDYVPAEYRTGANP